MLKCTPSVIPVLTTNVCATDMLLVQDNCVSVMEGVLAHWTRMDFSSLNFRQGILNNAFRLKEKEVWFRRQPTHQRLRNPPNYSRCTRYLTFHNEQDHTVRYDILWACNEILVQHQHILRCPYNKQNQASKQMGQKLI